MASKHEARRVKRPRVSNGTGDTRERILDAAVVSLRHVGWERISVSGVAAAAGVSRPTVYAYFEDADVLLSAVIERAATTIVERLVARAARATTGREFLVEVVAASVLEFRADSSASLVGLVRPGDSPVSGEALAIARRFLLPLLTYEPELVDDFDEISETIVRFILSLTMFESSRTRSPKGLRGYIERRLLPALGMA